MIRILVALFASLLFVPAVQAKSPPICGGAFLKAAAVTAQPVTFKAQKLDCRSLKDGPRGYQLQCIGAPELSRDAVRIAYDWSQCMLDAGFRDRPQGQNESIKVTELRHDEDRIVCTLIKSAEDDTRRLWVVKMKCFGPR